MSERNIETVHVVNSFSGAFMKDGRKAEVPDHLKDPRIRKENQIIKAGNALADVMSLPAEPRLVSQTVACVANKFRSFFSKV